MFLYWFNSICDFIPCSWCLRKLSLSVSTKLGCGADSTVHVNVITAYQNLKVFIRIADSYGMKSTWCLEGKVVLLHLLYNALLRSESRIVTLNHSSKLHFIILYLNSLPENINNYLKCLAIKAEVLMAIYI